MLFHLDGVPVGMPPEDLSKRVNALVRDTDYDGPERRAEPRHRLIVPVAVVAATPDGKPVGEPFRAMTRDISASGVCLLSPRQVNAPLVMVQFVEPSLGSFTTLVEVTRAL